MSVSVGGKQMLALLAPRIALVLVVVLVIDSLPQGGYETRSVQSKHDVLEGGPPMAGNHQRSRTRTILGSAKVSPY